MDRLTKLRTTSGTISTSRVAHLVITNFGEIHYHKGKQNKVSLICCYYSFPDDLTLYKQLLPRAASRHFCLTETCNYVGRYRISGTKYEVLILFLSLSCLESYCFSAEKHYDSRHDKLRNNMDTTESTNTNIFKMKC